MLSGYIPDYLVECVHGARTGCSGDVEVTVAHVNPIDAPIHICLLCRLETCRAAGPSFDAPEYGPLGSRFSVA
jgi:hypothetical protein